MPLDGLCWIFFVIFLKNIKGSLWGKSFKGNIKYFGAQIFLVVWPVVAKPDEADTGTVRWCLLDVNFSVLYWGRGGEARGGGELLHNHGKLK